MRAVLLGTTIAALVGVAACSGGDGSAGAGNVSAVPPGEITAATAPDLREDRFESMGGAMKAMNRELKAGSPDVALIQREAGNVVALAGQLPTWFPAGSGPESDDDTRAKSEIWTNPDGFREAHERFRAQAESFKRVADGGTVDEIRAAIEPLGKSCSNCHDTFRGPER